MGKYINIGNAEFESVRKDEYVDKSMLIAYVNKVLGTQRKFLCVTRARRFGKSIAAKMLNAYYDESVNSHALFHDLNIAKDPSCEQHLNKYPVIYLDASGFTSELTSDRQRVVYEMNDALSKELRKTYPDIHEINSRDAVLTLLIHLGYLSYDENRGVVRIPNYEVQQEFERTIRDEKEWGRVTKMLMDSERLLADTLAGNAKAVAAAIDDAHQDNTSILQYNDENSLACVLSLAYVAARKDYTMIRELPTGKGFADIVLLPNRNVDKPAVVLELKSDKSADAAIAQIMKNRYAESLKDYMGEVVLVGINYDKKTKKHECMIERLSDKPVLSSDKVRDKVVTKYSIESDKVILLLEALHQPLSAVEMRQICERKSVTYFNSKTLQPMLADGIITETDKKAKRSPKQRYYLTDKGLALLAELTKE